MIDQMPPHRDSHLRYSGDPDAPEGFDQEDPFGSVLFWLSGASVAEMATAIEKNGFYTWDEFGRFVRVPGGDLPQTLEHYRRELKAELVRFRAAETEAIGSGTVHQVNPTDYPRCRTSGWRSSEVPDFWELGLEWNKEQVGSGEVPENPDEAPSRRTSIYKILEGLLVLKYGPTIVDDLRRPQSKLLSKVETDLSAKGYQFDIKTLRKYFRGAVR